MQDCKSIPIPLPINYSSRTSPSSEAERMKMSRVLYALVVGSLMYVMICTRPNIAQVVWVVSRCMAFRWEIVRREVPHWGLTFGDHSIVPSFYNETPFPKTEDF